MLIFISLANQWPKLMQHWQTIDKQIPPYNNADDPDNDEKNKEFHRRIRYISIIIFALFFGK